MYFVVFRSILWFVYRLVHLLIVISVFRITTYTSVLSFPLNLSVIYHYSLSGYIYIYDMSISLSGYIYIYDMSIYIYIFIPAWDHSSKKHFKKNYFVVQINEKKRESFMRISTWPSRLSPQPLSRIHPAKSPPPHTAKSPPTAPTSLHPAKSPPQPPTSPSPACPLPQPLPRPHRA